MSDYALIQIARTATTGFIALGVGAVVIGVGIAIRALAGGSRRRLNELTERVLDLEDRLNADMRRRERIDRDQRKEFE